MTITGSLLKACRRDRRRAVRWSSIVLSMAGLLTYQLAGAMSASAVSGIQIVQGHSSTGSPDWNRAYAQCPAGQVAIGGGGDIVGGGHGVRLGDESVYGGTFEASAAENSAGYSPNWTLYDYAVCATPPSGLVAISGGSTIASTSSYTVQAHCPTGTRLLSSGLGVNYDDGRVFVTNLEPYSDLTGFSATINDDGGPSNLLTLYTSGVCATALPGLELVAASSASTSTDKTASVECPAGKRVVSVGGGVYGASGHAYLDRMVPHGSVWTGADVDAREDPAGTGSSWYASVYAICAL